MKQPPIFLVCFLLLVDAVAQPIPAQETSKQPNFVFIAVDDLNDFSGFRSEDAGNFLQMIYPDAEVRRQVVKKLTPNLDRLASKSAPFTRAYCASPLCGPSRTALMTGVPTHASGYYEHSKHFRTYESLRNAVTLPQHLKANGYFTIGLGKLFHKGIGSVDGPIGNDWADARFSWSQWVNHPSGCGGGMPSRYSPPEGGLMQFGPSRLTLEQAGDYLTADFAASLLEHGQAKPASSRNSEGKTAFVRLPTDQPFFLGCGLFRPHLPFHAPQEFFDRFPVDEMSGLNRETLDAIITDLDDLPDSAKRFSDFGSGKMRTVMEHARMIGGAETEVPAWRAMVQAYLACVCFADRCLGQILDGYERSPHRDNTVLVLWSDHGFHLGSKYHVAKQALWEEANRVQLLIRDPRNPHACDGQARTQIVSLMDLYPTLCDLAGVKIPEGVAGKSLRSLLDSSQSAEIHTSVLMTYQPGNHCLRTPSLRLTRYADGGAELYDMQRDPDQRNNLLAIDMKPDAEAAKLLENLMQRISNESRSEASNDTSRRKEKARQRRAENAAKRKAARQAGKSQAGNQL